MPLKSRETESDAPTLSYLGDLRGAKAILWRGLFAGVGAGGLLGALVVLPDSIKAQFDPEPDTAYAATWSALLIAVAIGALVAFMPALLAVVVWEWQVTKGARRARVAGSATAAIAVFATGGIHTLLTAAPENESWTIQGLVVLGIVAMISFAIAYLLVPVITIRRRGRGARHEGGSRAVSSDADGPRSP